MCVDPLESVVTFLLRAFKPQETRAHPSEVEHIMQLARGSEAAAAAAPAAASDIMNRFVAPAEKRPRFRAEKERERERGKHIHSRSARSCNIFAPHPFSPAAAAALNSNQWGDEWCSAGKEVSGIGGEGSSESPCSRSLSPKELILLMNAAGKCAGWSTFCTGMVHTISSNFGQIGYVFAIKNSKYSICIGPGHVRTKKYRQLYQNIPV